MPNALCHFELMTADTDKCRSFYGELFRWQFDEASMPGYTLIQPGTEPSGGMFAKPAQAPGPCMNVYFNVDDIDATLTKAANMGGSVLVPKTAVPGVGHFAMVTDPEGITFGIMQSSHS